MKPRRQSPPEEVERRRRLERAIADEEAAVKRGDLAGAERARIEADLLAYPELEKRPGPKKL